MSGKPLRHKGDVLTLECCDCFEEFKYVYPGGKIPVRCTPCKLRYTTRRKKQWNDANYFQECLGACGAQVRKGASGYCRYCVNGRRLNI